MCVLIVVNIPRKSRDLGIGEGSRTGKGLKISVTEINYFFFFCK